MLDLAHATDDRWAAGAVLHLDEILLEQAHLEKKAAAAALRFLFRYPDRVVFQAPLAALAREELEHFELILQQLQRRAVPFGRQHASPYAAEVLRVVRDQEPERLLDSFLCSALIEARSCERMRLLGVALGAVDPELATLYRELVTSEARHHATYVRLAETEFPLAVVETRLREIAQHEAGVVARMPVMGRLHTA